MRRRVKPQSCISVTWIHDFALCQRHCNKHTHTTMKPQTWIKFCLFQYILIWSITQFVLRSIEQFHLIQISFIHRVHTRTLWQRTHYIQTWPWLKGNFIFFYGGDGGIWHPKNPIFYAITHRIILLYRLLFYRKTHDILITFLASSYFAKKKGSHISSTEQSIVYR